MNTNENTMVPALRFPGFSGDWEQRKLGEHTKLITKGTTPEDKSGNGSINFVKIENISNGKINSVTKISKKEHENYLKRSKLQENDILFSIAGTLGRIAVVDAAVLPANTNQALSIIRGYDFDTNFLKISLSSKVATEFIRKNPTVGAQPNLSLEQIGKLDVWTPKTGEQIKLGNFFTQLDDLITLHQSKLDHLQDRKKALLQQLFPKNGEVVAKLRFPGFSGDWVERKLGDVTKFLDGQRKPLESSVREPGPYPYYGASGVIDYVKDYLFDEELILLSEDGANIIDRNYRVCFLVSGKCWINNHAHVLRSLDTYYNKFICESLELINYDVYNTGTAQPKLNQVVCRNIKIMMPGFEEQQKIGDFFAQLDDSIALQQSKINHLQDQKKSLLQQLFI